MEILAQTFPSVGSRYPLGRSLGRKLSRQVEAQTIGPSIGAASLARELRRQERGSDFTGYTTNLTLRSLIEFLRFAGGDRWALSLVPVAWIRCWHTAVPVEEIYRAAGSGRERLLLENRVRRMAERILEGGELPGIFLAKSQQRPGTHWILDGHHRLLAHRVARAPGILAYHPLGMFGAGVGRKVAIAQAD